MIPESLRESIRGLSSSERQEVVNFIKFLEGGTSPKGASAKKSTDEGDGVLLYQILEEQGDGVPPLSWFRKQSSWRQFEISASRFTDWVRSGWGGRKLLSKADKVAVFRLASRLMFQDLATGGLPVNANTIMYGVKELPSLVDRAFPSYAQQMLLSKIVKRADLEQKNNS